MGSMNRRSRGFCRKNCSARFVITTTIGAVFGLFSVFRFHRFPFTGFTFRQILVVQNHYLRVLLFPRPTFTHADYRDLQKKPKYLVTFTVGIDQMNNIYKCVKKFSEDFQTSLFHYDGRGPLNGTDWSGRRMQSMWYAKRFLHPDIFSAYDYIFIWDEDLGVEHFNADRYIKPVKKHDLEISQPGLEPNYALTWQMTKRRVDREVHKFTKEKPGWCSDPRFPPCAAFVEIMAPVFAREAWRCVWYLIQNDLVHGWGLDFALRSCVTPAHEKIDVLDSEWIVHQVISTLGNQGEPHA
ncbi:uncharacterized protein LOC120174907 [Hibiscus syriacus]|uniref:uncharacterized protein LOC120174907 n=1 Tax=Hibiscus syriacus TaxID=106335 RepID=UPI001924DEDD|nr:uncharacterized protein LOC120174907 [Hibiscus syriacus]